MDLLLHIKRLVIRGDVLFTRKSREEMDADDLSESEVIEAIVNARRVDKVLASISPNPPHRREKLYVIKGPTLAGRLVYTKGVVRRHGSVETFCVLISSKDLT